MISSLEKLHKNEQEWKYSLKKEQRSEVSLGIVSLNI